MTTGGEIFPALETRVEADSCPNCGAARDGAYCQQCGQKKLEAQDLTVRHFLTDALHELTDFDSKIFKTFAALLFRPGRLTAEYLAGRQERYLTPVKLYLIISAVYFFFAWDASLEISNFEQGLRANMVLQNVPLPTGTDQSIFFPQWFEKAGEYSGYLRFVSVVFYAAALAVLYYGARKFFVEHLVFAFHYYSFDFCLFALLILPLKLFSFATGWRVPSWTLIVGFVVLPFYTFVALRRVYRESVPRALIKSAALLMCDFVLTIFSDAVALNLAYAVVYLSLR